MTRKFKLSTFKTSWIAPDSLYQLWKFSCSTSTEMFADCLTQSGVLDAYCAFDPYDGCFDARGIWEDSESKIEGGAENSPFSY